MAEDLEKPMEDMKSHMETNLMKEVAILSVSNETRYVERNRFGTVVIEK